MQLQKMNWLVKALRDVLEHVLKSIVKQRVGTCVAWAQQTQDENKITFLVQYTSAVKVMLKTTSFITCIFQTSVLTSSCVVCSRWKIWTTEAFQEHKPSDGSEKSSSAQHWTPSPVVCRWMKTKKRTYFLYFLFWGRNLHKRFFFLWMIFLFFFSFILL